MKQDLEACETLMDLEYQILQAELYSNC